MSHDYPIRVLGGLPAIGRVFSFLPYTPATWHDPADGPEIDFEILDRKGRKAEWIYKRMTEEQMKDVEVNLLERCADDYRNRSYDD